jgi:hypothetical protein
MFILDPGSEFFPPRIRIFFSPGSRIHVIEFKKGGNEKMQPGQRLGRKEWIGDGGGEKTGCEECLEGVVRKIIDRRGVDRTKTGQEKSG